MGFIDYEKAFDSIEHFAIFNALRRIGANEIYTKIIENIYKNASARVHLDNHVSEPFPIERGVRQGDPISPKLFTAAIEEVFKEADLKEGIKIGEDKVKDLRFADDVALCTKRTEDMESNLNKLDKASKEVGLKIHKGKTKFMTNYESNCNIKIDNELIEEVEEYKYLGQVVDPSQNMETEINARIRAAWSSFGKNKEIFTDKEIPLCLKRKLYNQCVLPTLTYGCETWAITKAIMKKSKDMSKSDGKENDRGTD